MTTFARLVGRDDNKYIPALLILVWEDESLEEVVERVRAILGCIPPKRPSSPRAQLDIEDDVAFFDHATVLSLEDSDDLDARFAQALEEIVLDVTPKSQVVIHLRGEYI